MLRRLRALAISVAHSVPRSAAGTAILVIVVALLIRVAFAVIYVGTGRVKHAAKPPRSSHTAQAECPIRGGGPQTELAAVGGDAATDPNLPLLDQDGYTVLGMRMLTEKHFTDTRRQPLYPALHALVFATFGKHPTLLYNRLAGAVLSAFLSGLIYLIARRISGHTVGLVAGLLSAVHLNLIHKSGYVYSEVLAVPLLTLALYWFLVYTDNRKRCFLVLGGLALGLATLARPTTYYMIFLLPLVLWAVHGKMSRIVLARSAVVVAVSLAVIAPWAVRNAVVSGRFMPVSELKTWSLLCGCYGPSQFEQPLACDKGVWTGLAGCGLFTEQEAEQLAVTTLDEQERVCKRRFLGYMSTAWPRIPELLYYRALVFIGFDSRPGFFQLYGAQQVLFFGLFVGGLWISRAQWRRFSILHSASLFLGAFMGLAFYAGSRMRLYVDPVIIVFGSAYLVRLAERLFLRQRDTSVVLQPRQAPAQALAARRSR